MKCSKLHLQERSKPKANRNSDENPRRFCQKRMVNPEHEEDPRWADVYERFYCNDSDDCDLNETNESEKSRQGCEDLFLSVQNLQFQGNVEQGTRPRTSFKYKTLSDGQKHRMFVKQLIDDSYRDDAACSSILSDYGDEYAKYFLNNQSRPSSSKSSVVLFCLNNKFTENKSVQVDLRHGESRKKSKVVKSKNMKKINNKTNANDDIENNENDYKSEDTKITFRKNGKRKSLTISRTQSPATVQVIRVDVVCNYSCSSTMSDYEDHEENKKELTTNEQQGDKENKMKPKKSHFANKYLLTKTVKTLDENISGGKVTLMCKTYRLSNRKPILDRNPKILEANAEQGVCKIKK